MTASVGTGCGCGCGSATGTTVQAAAGERTRYYPRQLVSAADLTQDQLYFRERARRHNRLLHGWGIVCGAEVKVSDKPGHVDVNTGFILGPYGDEILIDEVVTVDLSSRNEQGDNADGCADPDPWCAELRVAPESGKPVYLAIAYAEYPCRPVQAAVSACSCGCDDTVCEYSRWRDSYRIRVLDTLPDSYEATLNPPSSEIVISCPVDASKGTKCHCPACSSCPSSPWVVLADITVRGEEIVIDCDAHRRYVASFRDFYFVCPGLQRAVALPDLVAKPALQRIRTHAGDLAREVAKISAKDLAVKIPENLNLTKRLEPITVDDVASLSRDAFVAKMATGAAAASRTAVAEIAGQVWEKAIAAKRIAEEQRNI